MKSIETIKAIIETAKAGDKAAIESLQQKATEVTGTVEPIDGLSIPPYPKPYSPTPKPPCRESDRLAELN